MPPVADRNLGNSLSASVGMSAYFFARLRYFELRALSHKNVCFSALLQGALRATLGRVQDSCSSRQRRSRENVSALDH
jgi:hypothetical protein